MQHVRPRVDAFVFDLFGVIIAFDNDIVPARLARHCPDPEDALRRLDGLMARREIITGAVTLDHVHRRIVDTLGLALTYPQFEAAWLAPYSWPMPGMADVVRALATDHPLVLLSNVDHYYWQVVRAMHSELDVFTELVVSCDLGSAKPNPVTFAHASRAAGIPPERCLFVDDTAVNVDAAQTLGFQTHLFHDTAGFLRTLDRMMPARPFTP